MDEKVAYDLFALIAKTIPIDKRKTLPPKIINHKNFTQNRRPSEKSDRRRRCHLPNVFPRKQGRLMSNRPIYCDRR